MSEELPRRLYIDEPRVERVDLGDENWVDVRVGIPWAEVLDAYDDSGTQAGPTRSRQALAALLRLGIAGWGGPGLEGLPFSVDAIARLRLENATRLGMLVSEKNPDIAASPKGTPAPGSDSSPAEKPA
jgi:hypothetical protein